VCPRQFSGEIQQGEAQIKVLLRFVVRFSLAPRFSEVLRDLIDRATVSTVFSEAVKTAASIIWFTFPPR
jgi:hypothetical protein